MRLRSVPPDNGLGPYSIANPVSSLVGVPTGEPGREGAAGKTLHWEAVVGGYQQFDELGNPFGPVLTGLTLTDMTDIDGGTPSSPGDGIIEGGGP